MKERKAIALLLAALMCLLFAACGSQKGPEKETATPSEKPIKIGIMQFGEFDALLRSAEGFKEGIAASEALKGKKIEFNYQSASADPANCPTIADALINDGSDLIFAIATPSLSCIKEKTNDIPVIFAAVTDPVSPGFIKSSDRPGGNITGTSDLNPVKEQIDLLIKLVPGAETVAVFYSSSEPNSAVQFDLAKEALEKRGLKVLNKTISSVDEAKSAIESLKGKADAMYIPTDNTVADAMQLVSSVATDCGIPTVVGEEGMVKNGAFATYGVDYFELGKKAGEMAAKVLSSDDPLSVTAETPVFFQTENLTTAINTKTAKALGLEIPEDLENLVLID